MNQYIKTMFGMVAVLFCLFASAQTTTTIDYTGADLGAACNVFAGSKTVGGLWHFSLAGGVAY